MNFDTVAGFVSNAAYIEALVEGFTLESLKEARTDVATALVGRASRNLEVNLKRVDGRETAAVVVSTYEEKMDFLVNVRAAIAQMEERTLAEAGGAKVDFSFRAVDP